MISWAFIAALVATLAVVTIVTVPVATMSMAGPLGLGPLLQAQLAASLDAATRNQQRTAALRSTAVDYRIPIEQSISAEAAGRAFFTVLGRGRSGQNLERPLGVSGNGETGH